MTSERFATFAAKKTDKQQGNCFGCHKPGHLEKDCPKKVTKSSQKQAIYTSRVRVGEGQEQQGDEHIQVGAPDNVKEATAEKETRSRRGEPHGEDLSVRTGDGDVCAVEEWCFDNAANVHIVSDRRYFTEYTPFSKDAEKVRGFKKQFAAAPAGHGTVELVVERNGKKMIMNLLDAYHVPNCRNLLSHSQAEDQGWLHALYPLKTKNAPEVNAEMIRYIEWTDRQHPTCKVKNVITDGGGEFENDEMKLWYQSKGIEFLPNPPRSSPLNPCERAHQTLVHMMKTMLIAAGFPPSLKMHALKMAD
ncbi:hypothetical protein PR003_g25349 [Phytophthora rubi]|uniref:CCHC-type domain-containing protein n=2 Tax=Phytophthora rubi TaxID=129364 RepID=A0A6A4CL13_9STRA|nr:hypothetical protein PR003_g25349 [Phytophthora rubi]